MDTSAIVIALWALSAVLGAAIGGVLRHNPVAGFALGLGYGPLGVVLAYFLEGDDAVERT